MDPRYLVQLAVIIELGSLSRAAERLNLTQPTLTRNIKIIEDRTGSPVIKRERYGVSATDLGKQLAQLGREIRLQTDKSRDLITTWQAGLLGELHVGIAPHVAHAFSSELIRCSINDNWPYTYHVYAGIISAHFAALAQGTRDIVIAPDPARMPPVALTRVPLFSAEVAVIIGAKSKLITKKEITPEDMAAARWFSPGTRAGAVNDAIWLQSLNRPVVFSAYCYGESAQALELLETSDFLCPMPLELFEVITRNGTNCRAVRLPKPTRRPVSAWVCSGELERPEIQHYLAQVRAVFKEYLPANLIETAGIQEDYSAPT